MQGIPQKIDQLFELLANKSDDSERMDLTGNENDKDNESEDPISALIQRSKESSDMDTDSLKEILNQTVQQDDFDPPINEYVAKSINDLYSTAVSAKNSKEGMKSKLRIPENCQSLGVPKVNPEIWSLLPSNLRQKDFSLQQFHQTLSTASVSVAKIADVLFTTKDQISQPLREFLLSSTMEAAAVLAQASEEMNKKRKNEIKPALNKEFIGICANSTTKGGLLFGDNFPELLRSSKATSQVVKNVVRIGSGQKRFHPYGRFSQTQSALNWRAPPHQARGGFNRPTYRRASWNANRRGKFPTPNYQPVQK